MSSQVAGAKAVVEIADKMSKLGITPGKPATVVGAYACLDLSGVLKPWQFELPAELGPNEVDIRVTHNGICHTDYHMAINDWGATATPFVPGHEVVGEVLAVGKEVKNLKIGQRVGAGWIKDSCRRCGCCIRGEENLCDKGYTGLIVMGGKGGFASVVRIPADFAFEIPDTLSSADAAPLLCAGITVFAPLKKYLIRPGMSVCVLGPGGLGHLAIQFASAMGAVVTVMGRNISKKEECLGLGASHFELLDDDVAKRCASRFDFLINCASANVDCSPLLSTLRNDGVLCQVGIPGGGVKMTVDLIPLVFGQKKVVGSVVGGRSDMQNMLQLAADKNIRPIIEVFPSTQFNEAFTRVKECKGRYRVVIDMISKPDPVLTLKQ